MIHAASIAFMPEEASRVDRDRLPEPQKATLVEFGKVMKRTADRERIAIG